MNPRSIFQPKTKIEATPHPKDKNFTQKYQNPVTTFISIIKPSIILTKKKNNNTDSFQNQREKKQTPKGKKVQQAPRQHK